VISTKQKSEGVRRERKVAPLKDWKVGEAPGLEQVADCQLKREQAAEKMRQERHERAEAPRQRLARRKGVVQ
jgi:hypothetical protein